MAPIKTLALIGLLLTTGVSYAQDSGSALTGAPPAAPYAKVSDLVPLPAFLPGMGELYVDPSTLPAGPFLAYDHDGALVSTIYMIPLADISPDGGYDNLDVPVGNVDHTDVYYNAGHPGVEAPHAHIVLWHVPVADEARVAQ